MGAGSPTRLRRRSIHVIESVASLRVTLQTTISGLHASCYRPAHRYRPRPDPLPDRLRILRLLLDIFPMKPNNDSHRLSMTLLGSTFLIAGATAVAAGVVEPTGINFTWPDSHGADAIALPDGSSIIAGSFDVAHGELRNGITRLRPDGTPDTQWNVPCVGLEGYQGCVFTQIELGPDGWVYVLGHFARIGGELRNGMARVALADGSVDATWNPVPTGADRPYDLILVPDGVIASTQAGRTKYALTGAGAPMPAFQTSVARLVGFAGGALFGTAQFSPPTLVRIDPETGQTDATWSAGVEAAQWLLADAGSASIIGRTAATPEEPAGRLVKVDALANPGVQPGWRPPAMEFNRFLLGADGDLHILGPTSESTGQAKLITVDLEGTGAVLRQIDLPPIFSTIGLLAVDASGAVILHAYAAEDFQPAGWTADGSTIGRATATGALDQQWQSGIFDYAPIHAAEITPDGGILVAGAFDRVGGVPRRGIAKLTADLQLDPWQAQVPQAGFTAASVDAAGNVYVSSRDGLATLLKLSGETGTVDTSWNPSGVAGPVNGEIEELLVDRVNNVLYARFPSSSFEICGANRTRLAKLSLSPTCTADPALQIQPAAPLLDLLVHEGFLYISGNFDTVAGQPIASLARFGANGAIDTTWSPFGASIFPGPAVAWATPTSRGLVASGTFSSAQGSPRPGIAMFDYLTGTLDSAWADLGDQSTVLSTGSLGDDVLLHKLDNSTPGSIGQLALVPIDGHGGTDPGWPALTIKANAAAHRPIFMLPLNANSTLVIGPFSGFGDTATGNTALLHRQPVAIFADSFEASP